MSVKIQSQQGIVSKAINYAKEHPYKTAAIVTAAAITGYVAAVFVHGAWTANLANGTRFMGYPDPKLATGVKDFTFFQRVFIRLQAGASAVAGKFATAKAATTAAAGAASAKASAAFTAAKEGVSSAASAASAKASAAFTYAKEGASSAASAASAKASAAFTTAKEGFSSAASTAANKTAFAFNSAKSAVRGTYYGFTKPNFLQQAFEFTEAQHGRCSPL